jgi:hypothetical protein
MELERVSGAPAVIYREQKRKIVRVTYAQTGYPPHIRRLPSLIEPLNFGASERDFSAQCRRSSPMLDVDQ